jgi:hypothetical protein
MKIIRKTIWRDKREEILGEERATVLASQLYEHEYEYL